MLQVVSIFGSAYCALWAQIRCKCLTNTFTLHHNTHMLRLALYDSCTLAADMASRPKLARSPSTASSSSSMSRYIWRQRCDTTCSWFRRSASEARKDCCIWSSDTRVRCRRMACSTDSLDSYSDRLLCSVCTATHSWVNWLVQGHTRDMKFYQ